MFKKFKLQRKVVFGLIFMISCGSVTTEGKSYCSCWDSGLIDAKCGWGLDWDTEQISHSDCGTLCQRHAPQHLWPNVTQHSFNRCKNEGGRISIADTQEKQNSYLCEIWGPGSAACN